MVSFIVRGLVRSADGVFFNTPVAHLAGIRLEILELRLVAREETIDT